MPREVDARENLLVRLRRVEGQVRGVQKMVEEDRYCPDVLVQMSAIHESLRAVERILMVLADKLHLPRYAPDGQLMSYKFHHRRLGVQLVDDQTLAQQRVEDADIVRIQPEITAGGRAVVNAGRVSTR